MSELDQLLDINLDDLEDLPEYKPYPAGTHRVVATMSTDTIKDNPVVKLDFVYIECIELVNTQEEAPKEGDTSSMMFMLNNKYGLANFKKCAKPFGEALGCTSGRETVESTTDIECIIVTTLRVDKNDPDKKYLNVKEIGVV